VRVANKMTERLTGGNQPSKMGWSGMATTLGIKERDGDWASRTPGGGCKRPKSDGVGTADAKEAAACGGTTGVMDKQRRGGDFSGHQSRRRNPVAVAGWVPAATARCTRKRAGGGWAAYSPGRTGGGGRRMAGTQQRGGDGQRATELSDLRHGAGGLCVCEGNRIT
jgi:hypothetical protein